MTSGIILVIIPYCNIYSFTICCIRNSLLSVTSCKVLLDFLQYQLFPSLTVLTATILFIVNCIRYFLMHQVLLIISAITLVSAITQFHLFFFTVSITNQNLLILSLQYPYQVGFFFQLTISGPSFSVVIISATHLSYFYQHTVSAIKQSYHLFTRGNSTIHLCQVSYCFLVLANGYLLPK